jgi:poly(3-hydroxybutyrate) depolymerase
MNCWGANCPPQLRRAAAQRRVVLFKKISCLTNTTPALRATPPQLRRGVWSRCRRTLFILALVPAVSNVWAAQTQTSGGTVLEETLPPGDNYNKAAFRFWYPKDGGSLQAIIVLMPGSNGDGRPMADDAVWQDFAARHRLALIGCQFTDKPHEQNFIEQYVNVSRGSGQALLDAISVLARRAEHPELTEAPLFLWGMSAGGQFNYEFVAWKPERVAAFVVNKGGIYYTALTSRQARNVPGLLFIGGKDLDSRIRTISGLFALNRRGGALWALAEEPGAAHIVGRSRDMALMFFEDALMFRFEDTNREGPARLKSVAEKSGFIGSLKSKTFQSAADPESGSSESTVWLPTARVARAWEALLGEKPFEP